MLYTKFPEDRSTGSREEGFFFKNFYHIWSWRPSWSCDLKNISQMQWGYQTFQIWLSFYGCIIDN